MSDLIKHINAIRNIPVQEDVIKYKIICELIDREGNQFEEKTGERTEVRHGRWIEADDMPRLDNTFSIRCSLCGQLMLAHPNDENPNFCCNCGAKMDEVAE